MKNISENKLLNTKLLLNGQSKKEEKVKISKLKRNFAGALLVAGALSMLLGFGANSLSAADATVAKITDKLLGYWRFDENSTSSFADSSGNCDDLVPDEQYCQNLLTMIPGKLGKAVAFDGTGNDWGETIPVNSKALSGKNDELCMAFWIQPLAWNTDKTIDIEPRRWGRNEFIRKGHSFYVCINKDDNETSGELFFAIYKENWRPRSEKYRLPLKEWTFVVWNFKAKEGGRLFINGKAVGSVVGEADDIIPVGPEDLGIGRTNANTALDEFAIWGRVLSETEIADMYNDGKGKAIIPAPQPKTK
jgi:hypothetical protein